MFTTVRISINTRNIADRSRGGKVSLDASLQSLSRILRKSRNLERCEYYLYCPTESGPFIDLILSIFLSINIEV